jgi:hypothetical protein
VKYVNSYDYISIASKFQNLTFYIAAFTWVITDIPATLNIPVIMSMSHGLQCFVTCTIMKSAVNKMCGYFQGLFPV